MDVVSRPLCGILGLSWFLLTGSTVFAAILPEGATITGPAVEENSSIRARATPVVIQGNIPPGMGQVTLAGKVGSDGDKRGDLSLVLQGSTEKPIRLAISTNDWMKYKATDPDDTIVDTIFRVGESRIYLRPNPRFIKPSEYARLKPEWRKLPPASEHWFSVTLRPLPNGKTGVWLDNRFVNVLDSLAPLTSYRLQLRNGATVRELQFAPSPPASRFVPLDIIHAERAGSLADAKLTLDDAGALPNGFRELSGTVPVGMNIGGLGRVPDLGREGLWSMFWERNDTDNLPGQRMFNVPLDNYFYAQILCAADSDPATEDAFTLRLTRYGTGVSTALADTQVTVPVSATTTPAGSRVVGKLTGADGKVTPLWLLRVPVKNGLIQDLIQVDKRRNRNLPMSDYLDVEFLDPLRGVDQVEVFPPVQDRLSRTYSPINYVNLHVFDPTQDLDTMYPASNRSGVTVFGALLERAPASLKVRANTDIHVFTPADNPAWECTVEANVAGRYRLEWEFADVDGKSVVNGKSPVELADGEEKAINIPVKQGNGWYATRWRLFTAAGELLTDQRGSFVMLPPDMRQAGFESPFTTWWFSDGAHGSEKNIDRVGPFLQRAGIRHVSSLPESLPESVTGKYKVTASAVRWLWPRGTREESLQKHEALIQKYKELWPSVKDILVWHEGGPGFAQFPVEMWGGKPEPASEKADEVWKERLDYAGALAKLVREKFPGYRLQYGNDGTSLYHIAEMGRRGFPKKYVDLIATETAGQGFAPENAALSSLQSLWYLKETASKVGYGDVPLSVCFEWITRPDLETGRRKQAEWYVRDALHGLAYGLKTISLGGVQDMANGYYYTLWGNGGLAEQGPFMQPKPAYAAMATVTRVLDQAKFLRTVPTGSLGVYALEFKRATGYVYALWAPQGTVKTTVRFKSGAGRTVTDLYGREKLSNSTSISLDVNPGTVYINSTEPVASIQAEQWKFPLDFVPAKPTLVDAMDDAGRWTLASGADPSFDRPGTSERETPMPLRVPGKFDLRAVNDPEKGQCLELELRPEGDLWAGTHEYTVLAPVTPVAPPGNFTSVGVWVKGNGSQGDLMLKLEDSKGKKWSTSTQWQDWPAKNKFNYDGWRFLSVRLPKGDNWKSGVKITGLAVTIPRKTLFLTEMVPVSNKTLRFKGLCLY